MNELGLQAVPAERVCPIDEFLESVVCIVHQNLAEKSALLAKE